MTRNLPASSNQPTTIDSLSALMMKHTAEHVEINKQVKAALTALQQQTETMETNSKETSEFLTKKLRQQAEDMEEFNNGLRAKSAMLERQSKARFEFLAKKIDSNFQKLCEMIDRNCSTAMESTDLEMKIESDSVPEIKMFSDLVPRETEGKKSVVNIDSVLQGKSVLAGDLLVDEESYAETEEIQQQISNQTEASTHIQVPYLQLEPSLRFHIKSLGVCNAYYTGFSIGVSFDQQRECLGAIEVLRMGGRIENSPRVTICSCAHQLFEQMFIRGKTENQQRIVRKLPKSWKFKYKLKKPCGLRVVGLIWFIDPHLWTTTWWNIKGREQNNAGLLNWKEILIGYKNNFSDTVTWDNELRISYVLEVFDVERVQLISVISVTRTDVAFWEDFKWKFTVQVGKIMSCSLPDVVMLPDVTEKESRMEHMTLWSSDYGDKESFRIASDSSLRRNILSLVFLGIVDFQGNVTLYLILHVFMPVPDTYQVFNIRPLSIHQPSSRRKQECSKIGLKKHLTVACNEKIWKVHSFAADLGLYYVRGQAFHVSAFAISLGEGLSGYTMVQERLLVHKRNTVLSQVQKHMVQGRLLFPLFGSIEIQERLKFWTESYQREQYLSNIQQWLQDQNSTHNKNIEFKVQRGFQQVVNTGLVRLLYQLVVTVAQILTMNPEHQAAGVEAFLILLKGTQHQFATSELVDTVITVWATQFSDRMYDIILHRGTRFIHHLKKHNSLKLLQFTSIQHWDTALESLPHNILEQIMKLFL